MGSASITLLPGQTLPPLGGDALKEGELPLATQYLLYPKDATNFVNKKGRIETYATFNHSQYLNFKAVARKDMTQEKLTPAGFIPDIVEELDNIKEDKFHSFDAKERLAEAGTTVAYVKCSLDDKFYMTPRMVTFTDEVFGREVVDIGYIVPPRRIWNEKYCRFEDSYNYYQAD